MERYIILHSIWILDGGRGSKGGNVFLLFGLVILFFFLFGFPGRRRVLFGTTVLRTQPLFSFFGERRPQFILTGVETGRGTGLGIIFGW